MHLNVPCRQVNSVNIYIYMRVCKNVFIILPIKKYICFCRQSRLLYPENRLDLIKGTRACMKGKCCFYVYDLIFLN